MARRFTSGRQGEQFLDPNSFKAFNRIKYLGNSNEPENPERQADFEDCSLWLDRSSSDKEILKSYRQGTGWKPIFEGYYHPAMIRTSKPMYPIEGQIWIDTHGTLRYYEDKQWKVANAATLNDFSSVAAGISNFLIMPNMHPVTGSRADYLVPHITCGKLFDKRAYVPSENLNANSIVYYDGEEIKMTYPLGSILNHDPIFTGFGEKSWVHVNPAFLYGTRKRFIKIINQIKHDYFINVPTTNTEFYGFKHGECYGHLLRNFEDENIDNEKERTNVISGYKAVSGGIQLLQYQYGEINPGCQYDYIYAITYNFDTVEDGKFGNLIQGNVTIGENNEVFVGQIVGVPLVFLNGTYLEQEEYSYNSTEGMLSFSGATITNEMDLVVAAFANVVKNNDGSIFEFVVSNDKNKYPEIQGKPGERNVYSGILNNQGEDVLYIKHDSIKQQVRNFKHPIVFVQGVARLYDPEYGITDGIEFKDDDTIWVRDFGPMSHIENGEDEIRVLIADIGDAKLSSGTIGKDLRVRHEEISSDGKYLVFVNGICTAPSDHDVFANYLTIAELDEEPCVDMRYTVMSLDKGDKGIDLLFDSQVSNFTFPINDDDEANKYNDCDMAITYVYQEDNFDIESSVNGILIDKNHLQSNISHDNSYSVGEILLVKDENDESEASYVYKIFNVDGKQNWSNCEDTNEFTSNSLAEMEQMIIQFNGNGSISLIANDQLVGKKLAYYAYTYVNEIDEPILTGKNNSYRIPFEKHREDSNIIISGEDPIEVIPSTQSFFVSRTHCYSPAGKGILGTYVNGIQIKSIDGDILNGEYRIDTGESIDFRKTWGSGVVKDDEGNIIDCYDLYPLLKEIAIKERSDNPISMADLERMKKFGQYVKILRDYSITEEFYNGIKTLSNFILETEMNNELCYFVERMETGETMSVNRDWLTVSNRYEAFDNTYVATNYIGPGMVDIYLNGVMLDRSSYSIFDNNHIVLNDLNVAGGSDLYDANNPETHSIIKYYVIKENEEHKLVGSVETIEFKTPDEILVEYRPDTTIKKISYEIKQSTYDTGVLSYEEYDFPNSLIKTKDMIKIWIDGILYTGGYYIKGKDIVLKNNPLRLDPIQQYFDTHPDTYRKWKLENGEYSYRKSRIIFEWR